MAWQDFQEDFLQRPCSSNALLVFVCFDFIEVGTAVLKVQ